MKKLILIAIGVMILSMAIVGVASANNGPHGGYTNFTDRCAGCHRAHTAQNEYLLVASNTYDLCMVCHNGTGGGANTDVSNGVFLGSSSVNNVTYTQGTAGYRLNGGSFSAAGQTSRHDVEGMAPIGGGADIDGVGTAWGSISSDGTQGGVTAVLECTSCHNPHGSTSYRILNDNNSRWVTNDEAGVNVTARLDVWKNGLVQIANTDVTTSPAGSKGYTYVAEQLAGFGLGDDSTWAPTDQYNSKMIRTAYGAGMSWFCTGCHTAYGQTTHSQEKYGLTDTNKGPYGPANMGDSAGSVDRYGHKTYDTSGTARRTGTSGNPKANPLPFAAGPSTNANDTTYNGGGVSAERGFFTCLTCHFAHGSTQTMSGFANAADFGEVDNGTGGVAPTNDSANLFYDNRGVCRSCHQIGK